MHEQPWDCCHTGDPAIAEAARYLDALGDEGEAAACRRWPELHQASSIRQTAGLVGDQIEARLLAGEDFALIAHKTGVPASIITAYESLFFNVAHCLKAFGWIMCQVIRVIPGQPVSEGLIWRWIAYAAGPVVLEIVIDEFLNRPADPQFPESAGIAAKARFAFAEAATDWTLAESVRYLLAEGERLFPDIFRNACTNRDPFLAVHLANIRISLGIAEIESDLDVPATRRVYKPQTPRKDALHGNK